MAAKTRTIAQFNRLLTETHSPRRVVTITCAGRMVTSLSS
jgi:hypothetical protein